MKRLLTFLLTATSLWAGSFDCSNPNACTVTCTNSADSTAWANAISGANVGATITVSGAACAISSGVTINKFLTIIGTGALTFPPTPAVTLSGSPAPMITISHGTGGLVRFSNFIMNPNANAAQTIALTGSIDQVRIDHITCGAAAQCISVTPSPSYIGYIFGVVDHSTFTNCDRCAYGEGADIAGWSVGFTPFDGANGGNFQAGTGNAFFYEDNTFTRNASFGGAGNEIFYNQEGARMVYRYNTVDEHLWVASDSYPMEMHGNQSYFMQHNSAIAVSSFTGTSGTLTFTTASQSLSAGATTMLSGFSGGNTFLNGQAVKVLAAGLNATHFQAVVAGSGFSSGTGTANTNDCFRGNPLFEVYNNTFHLQGSPRVFAPRSGSTLFFNNVIDTVNTGSLAELLHTVEEEAWSGGGNFAGNPLGYNHTWPTEDMVTDTFVWNNTINGSALTRSNIDGASAQQGGNDSLGTYNNTTPDQCLAYDLALHCVIQENRDLWMHAPAASGGRTYYSGRAGAAGWNAEPSSLAFTASGANAYYPYTSYTYPHPLVGTSNTTTFANATVLAWIPDEIKYLFPEGF